MAGGQVLILRKNLTIVAIGNAYLLTISISCLAGHSEGGLVGTGVDAAWTAIDAAAQIAGGGPLLDDRQPLPVSFFDRLLAACPFR